MAELSDIPGLEPRIAATGRRLTALALAKAFWPLAIFLVVYLGSALLGGLERLGSSSAAAITLLAFALGAVLAMRGWRSFERPGKAATVAAMDAQSDLRPITSLSDRPARPTADAQTLWSVHGDRLRQAAAALRPPALLSEWTALDPYRARYALPALLLAALVFAGGDARERLGTALSPDIGALLGGERVRIEAWISPPAHTGRAPIFLSRDTTDVRAPAGSTLTIRAQSRSAPTLVLSGDDRLRTRFQATPDGAFEVKATIEADATASVRWWGERQAWRLLASPDSVPTARFVETPTVTTQDKTEFEYEVSDDYGVDRLDLVITLANPNPAAPDAEERTPVPLPGAAPKTASETATLDLTRHRWAGLEVVAQLVATDGAGQQGASEPYTFTLPEKLFLQPLAKAAQEARVTILREPRTYDTVPENLDAVRDDAINVAAANRLDAAPPDIQLAAEMLSALTFRPSDYFEDYAVYLGLRTALGLVQSAGDKAEADSVDPILWAVALKAEYGSAADALRALQAARRALEQALRDGASEDEIRRLMQAFKEAAENYVAAKLAEAMANGVPSQQAMPDGEAMGGGPSFGGQDFADMLEALEDLTETGASDQARQLLSDISNLLENLQFQQGGGSGGEGGWPGMPGQGGEGGEGSQAEQELSDTLQRLSDLLREQRELNDDTLAEGRGEGGPGEQSPNGLFGPPGAQGNTGEDGQGNGASGLADRQDELGDQLSDLDGRLGQALGEDDGDGLGPGGEEELLGAIEDAQRRAAEALRRGDQRLAERNQERATRLLRDLSGTVAEALDAERGGEEARQVETDPFGRAVGGAARDRSVRVPDEADRQRAKDILEELRSRFGDAEDEDERDYLERLLDRF
ncbi:MAG: DUF4175 family protein [Pseudomonadota bacterium]